MTPRKKKGLGSIISGAIFIVVGIIIYTTTATPAWVPTALQLIGTVGGILGFVFVFPDHE